MNRKEWSSYGPALVRWGLGIVFLAFGIWQFIDPSYWIGYLPDQALSVGLSAQQLIIANGILDTALGALLLLGLFTRIAAAVAALHLLSIAVSVGWNDVAVRDIGLALAALGVMLHGPDKWTIDRRRK